MKNKNFGYVNGLLNLYFNHSQSDLDSLFLFGKFFNETYPHPSVDQKKNECLNVYIFGLLTNKVFNSVKKNKKKQTNGDIINF